VSVVKNALGAAVKVTETPASCNTASMLLFRQQAAMHCSLSAASVLIFNIHFILVLDQF